MEKITKFRSSVRDWIERTKTTQIQLARDSGVDQGSLSRFLRFENPEGLSGESVLRLQDVMFGLSSASEGSPDV
jgi:hypothetical protein